ncbi:MAG: carboxysome shell carbonic anhydrase [Hydrogenovibrio sp.]|uniref:carboxysome shell carbonic anhydrase n=1 Tax=Hydrogenovibrio sp. TaxID=2065821 RepID=UPI00287063BB|nr:carboxysome shell carbonic anhydrase [Hydrogenovibrio sp.]MDR9499022.1 carboxysome shell carbonic anhydrase [Hydrogenovibrio sp.]
MNPARVRQKSMFWRKVAAPVQTGTALGQVKAAVTPSPVSTSVGRSEHALVNVRRNQVLRDYELKTKAGFDDLEGILKRLASWQNQEDFVIKAQALAQSEFGWQWPESLLDDAWKTGLNVKALYAYGIFKQFERLSQDFYQLNPLQDEQELVARQAFMAAGFHAVGIAPCADGRLAHTVSYVLRLPHTMVRRKAHAGVMFDVSESVRHWVFVEHDRFREGIPNPATESTRYLKIAVYHYSDKDPNHQGCAAHGSDEKKAASAALQKLEDFQQAIENRFGCGSRVEPMLLGLNTDNDSLKVHLPNQDGQLCLARYIKTETLFDQTAGWSADQARAYLKEAMVQQAEQAGSSAPNESIRDLLAWLIEQNFSQIAYVRQFEKGLYADIGHAERFIGLGNGFEEVQLRNLSYYGFLDTLEEGAPDVDVGIKIFKGLNVNRGLPAPVVIRIDYDGRVPGSRTRALDKVHRIEQALHQRYSDLSEKGDLTSLCTLRDHQRAVPCELVSMRLSPTWAEQYEV